MSDTTKPQPEQQPARQQVRRRTEQDAELDNLIWLQRTRESRLADQRRHP